MARTVGIGIQDFEAVISNDCFYVLVQTEEKRYAQALMEKGRY